MQLQKALCAAPTSHWHLFDNYNYSSLKQKLLCVLLSLHPCNYTFKKHQQCEDDILTFFEWQPLRG